MANPKEKPEERLTERIVVLVTPSFKRQFDGYCDAIGENQSAHIRATWEGEVALYDANRG